MYNNPPSQKQLDFIKTLIKEREFDGDTEPTSVAEASALIGKLLQAPKKAADVLTKMVTEDGMYVDPETKVIYKLQFNRAGGDGRRLYGKRLINLWDDSIEDPRDEDGDHGWKFIYEPGIVQKVRPEWRMTLEEAKQFGHLYGVCCVCGRTLTDEVSIAEGIGPICAGRI